MIVFIGFFVCSFLILKTIKLFCYYFTIKAQALHENHQKSLIVFRNQNEQTKNPMKTLSDSLIMILNLFYAFQQSQLPFR